MDVWAATICFNTVEAEKQGLTKPVSWQDLTKPEYKGKIVMPNPASSGTGFLDVSETFCVIVSILLVVNVRDPSDAGITRTRY